MAVYSLLEGRPATRDALVEFVRAVLGEFDWHPTLLPRSGFEPPHDRLLGDCEEEAHEIQPAGWISRDWTKGWRVNLSWACVHCGGTSPAALVWGLNGRTPTIRLIVEASSTKPQRFIRIARERGVPISLLEPVAAPETGLLATDPEAEERLWAWVEQLAPESLDWPEEWPSSRDEG